MLLQYILAVATLVNSPKIDNFMTLPNWMPTSVSSVDTFGSPLHVNASGRVTSNTLAAVESIFDAYYERLYYLNAAGTADIFWSTNTYGPRGFKNMTFGGGEEPIAVNYRNGNRTVPNTMRLVEFSDLVKFCGGDAFKQIIDTTAQFVEKDSWGSWRYCYMSSYALPGSSLPQEYDWATSVPEGYEFGACHPIFSCALDNSFHTSSTLRDDEECYPVPRMFDLVDNVYYDYFIEQRVEGTAITNTFPDIIRQDFPGSNAESGIVDKSYRLKPDEYPYTPSPYEPTVVTNSSLLATLSRALSTMDRTHHIPQYSNSGEISNVTISASRELQLEMRGQYVVTDLQFDNREGSFICDGFDDRNLSVVGSTNIVQNVSEYGSMSGAWRDRGRFGGTSTSLTTRKDGTELVINVSTVGELLSNQFRAPYDPEGSGSYYAELEFGGSAGAGRAGSTRVSFLCSVGESAFCGLYATGVCAAPTGTYSTVVSVKRSASSSRTLHPRTLTESTVNAIFPYPVPAASAFGNPSRVGSCYTTLLKYVCKHVYGSGWFPSINDDIGYNPNMSSRTSQTIYTSIVGANQTSSNSMRDNYRAARNDVGDKLVSVMNDTADGWTNPLSLCGVSASFIDSSARGTYVCFSGGTVSADVEIGGIVVSDGEGMVMFEVVPIAPSIGNGIQSISYTSPTRPARTFSNEDPVCIVIRFGPYDMGSGWRLSDDVTNVPAVAADGITFPMVTTGWLWNSLRISREDH